MEPYRFPEIDPGPGALLMSMPPGEIQQRVGSHLEAVAPAVGVMNRMGSRLTEDRPRMRAVLEVLAARRLFLVDAYTSSQSVAFDEARSAGVRAARRQILVDHARGEAGDRVRWDEVAGWAERRGEVVVVAHGHPLTVRLLKEYVPRWEARGLRLVPVSPNSRDRRAVMIVLGIETSCDETAAAVVDGGRKVLVEHRGLPGRRARALRRRGAGAGVAAAPRGAGAGGAPRARDRRRSGSTTWTASR